MKDTALLSGSFLLLPCTRTASAIALAQEQLSKCGSCSVSSQGKKHGCMRLIVKVEKINRSSGSACLRIKAVPAARNHNVRVEERERSQLQVNFL